MKEIRRRNAEELKEIRRRNAEELKRNAEELKALRRRTAEELKEQRRRDAEELKEVKRLCETRLRQHEERMQQRRSEERKARERKLKDEREKREGRFRRRLTQIVEQYQQKIITRLHSNGNNHSDDGNDILTKIAIVSDDKDESFSTDGNIIKADWKKEYTNKTSTLAKSISISNISPPPPPSPIPPQLSPEELHRFNIKREVQLRIEIQKKMKELQTKISPKKKKKEIVYAKVNVFAEARHCIFDNEFRKEFEFTKSHSNPFEITEDDDEYGPLDFIREHFYPDIPDSLVYESEYEHYYQEALRDRLRDDEWVEAVIQKERTENEYSSPFPSSMSNSTKWKIMYEQHNKMLKDSKEKKEKKAIAQSTPPSLIPSQVLHHDELKKYMKSIHSTFDSQYFYSSGSRKLGKRARKNLIKKRPQTSSKRSLPPPSCKRESNLFGDHPT